MKPWFIAVERFGPQNGHAWLEYLSWSKLTQLEELVSLDSLLCPPVFKKVEDHFWPHIVNEDFYLDYFTNLDFLRDQLTQHSNYRLLCVERNPNQTPELPAELNMFEFIGFDLVEAVSGVSALSNCGGWPELDNAELTKFGLISELQRALELQTVLPREHPEEHHADCDVWAIHIERT